ncbi:recombinase family protein [Staphylococcus pseudintermedius]|nr:recombinase family protein [Staphylococcus pseudintermedius]MDK3843697.1 recombinase family protein [Staphylococcus pseudintermedius]
MNNIMNGYYDELDNQESQIQNVAIYARKSRADEGEKDLVNHLLRLKARCDLNEWRYEIYKEIGSGSTIDDRPEMIRLLNDVQTGVYDAVVVVDLDRLSRGKGADLDRILGIFRNNNVKIVQESPYEVYNLANSDHAQMLEMKMFFGNMELMQSKKRFREGRRLARHLGKWVSGQAPLGYDIDRKTTKLVINEKEKEIIVLMKELYLVANYNGAEIAEELNSKGYRTKRGKLFTSSSVYKILKNETYTGTTVYNKSRGNHRNSKDLYSSGLPFERLDESKWKRNYNTHEPIISKKEYQQIIEKINENKYIREDKGRRSALSGLCYTPEGLLYTSGNYDRHTKMPKNITVKNRKATGAENYIAVPIKLVEAVILESLKILEEEIMEMLDSDDNTKLVEQQESRIEKINKEIIKIEDEIMRIQDGFLSGLFDAKEAKEIKEKKIKIITKKKSEIKGIEEEIDKVSKSKNITKLERINNFYNKIETTTDVNELNQIYKRLINKIIVIRKVNNPNVVNIKVNFK